MTSFTQHHVHNAHAAKHDAVAASLQHAIHAQVGWPILKAGTHGTSFFMISALFWAMQRRMVIPHRHFRTIWSRSVDMELPLNAA